MAIIGATVSFMSEHSSYISGKEIFEIKPLVLGGDPLDQSNKLILTRAEHIEAVRYWNRVIADLRNGRQDSKSDSG